MTSFLIPWSKGNPVPVNTSQGQRVRVIDSHTGGEPTRLVVSGGPDLGKGSLAERLRRFCAEHDRFRSAVVNEPRGSDVIVGALLCEPIDPACAAGVIFFNNVGYLGMCGHGTIGLIATLHFMGRIGPGTHRIETPVGTVTAVLHDDGQVTVKNIASYRFAANVPVTVPGYGSVHGDGQSHRQAEPDRADGAGPAVEPPLRRGQDLDGTGTIERAIGRYPQSRRARARSRQAVSLALHPV